MSKVEDYIRRNIMSFEVLAKLDELSLNVGFLCVEMEINNYGSEKCVSFLRQIQSHIFNISNDIDRDKIISINDQDIEELKNNIDFYYSSDKIFPGVTGTQLIAQDCRNITRQCEKKLRKLYYDYIINNNSFNINNETFVYINMLDVFFFTLAKYYA